MTYTFKLARRLARIRTGALIATSLTLACADHDSVGPDLPQEPEFIDVAPYSTALGVDGETQFQARRVGEAASDRYSGWWRGNLVDLELNPDSARLTAGSDQQFRAQVRTPDGTAHHDRPLDGYRRNRERRGQVYGRQSTWDVQGHCSFAHRGCGHGHRRRHGQWYRQSGSARPEPPQRRTQSGAASLRAGSTQQFAAVGRGDDGATVPVGVIYTAGWLRDQEERASARWGEGRRWLQAIAA